MSDYKNTSLWKKAFDLRGDGFDQKRTLLEGAYDAFRERVAILISHIKIELPSLTIHDITHVDALWRVGSEIAGPDYEINAAEAFVLGGAFLLHDAAHCRVAFSGGIAEIQNKPEWKDAAAHFGIDLATLLPNSVDFQKLLFETLRVLHPRQARSLPFAKWGDEDGGQLHLLPNDELREAYGDMIGQAAESHWFDPEHLEAFHRISRSVPICLSPAPWNVGLLKIALLLRVADAAHIDQLRAPRLLMLMGGLSGVSRDHWSYQSRMHIPRRNDQTSQLEFSSNPFPVTEQASWWLAYDTACMVDKELVSADHLLQEYGYPRFAAREVARIRSSKSFSVSIPTQGWHPVDASMKISDFRSVIRKFGGEELYGKRPRIALRELLQNSRDAILACRALGSLADDEGHITVSFEKSNGEDWLHVTDTGIGMSQYVLTQVLLDFGRSLWNDPGVRREWPGLLSNRFKPAGRFGVGFFSVFMLGDHVKVVTNRLRAADGDNQVEYVLDITSGMSSRPCVRIPTSSEKLNRHGTRVSVKLKDKASLMEIRLGGFNIDRMEPVGDSEVLNLHQLVGSLMPTSEIDVYTQEAESGKIKTITAGDWRGIDPFSLILRVSPLTSADPSHRQYDENIYSVGNMEDIFDDDGVLIGRASVCRNTSSIFGLESGVVVAGGISVGSISSIAGVFPGLPPPELDRSYTVPAISKASLARWANSQAAKLVAKNQLNWDKSSVLMSMGADPQSLFVVTKNGVDLTRSEFIAILQCVEHICLISKWECDYKSSMDPVMKADFDSLLKFSDDTFVIKEGVAGNHFINQIHWPRSLFGGGYMEPLKFLYETINSEWPDNYSEECDVKIGSVHDEGIFREGTKIYRRRP